MYFSSMLSVLHFLNAIRAGLRCTFIAFYVVEGEEKKRQQRPSCVDFHLACSGSSELGIWPAESKRLNTAWK